MWPCLDHGLKSEGGDAWRSDHGRRELGATRDRRITEEGLVNPFFSPSFAWDLARGWDAKDADEAGTRDHWRCGDGAWITLQSDGHGRLGRLGDTKFHSISHIDKKNSVI